MFDWLSIALECLFEYNIKAADVEIEAAKDSQQVASGYRAIKAWMEDQLRSVKCYEPKMRLGSNFYERLCQCDRVVKETDLNKAKYVIPFANGCIYYLTPGVVFANGNPDDLMVNGVTWNLEFDLVVPHLQTLQCLASLSNANWEHCHYLVTYYSTLLHRLKEDGTSLCHIDNGGSGKSGMAESLVKNFYPLYVFSL